MPVPAGIIAFQNEEYYYPLSVARVTGRTVVQLEKHAGTQTGAAGLIVSSAPGPREGVRGHHAGPVRDDRRTMIAKAMSHLEPTA